MNEYMTNCARMAFLTFAFLFLNTALTSIVIAETNLVLDPGFENGLTTPQYWETNERNGNIPLWDTASHSGSRSMKIEIPGEINKDSGIVYSNHIKAEPMTDYVFSAWGKTKGVLGAGTPVVRVIQADADNTWLSATILDFGEGTNNWTKKSINFRTGPDTSIFYITSFIKNGFGTFWVDDVELSLKSTTSSSQLLFLGDFETGNFGQWSNACLPDDSFSVVTDLVSKGRYAAKFVVGPKSTCWGAERSELVLKSPQTPLEVEGSEYYYAWSTLFPMEWNSVNNWQVITQWHPTYGIKPAISFVVSYNTLQLGVYTGIITESPEVSYQYYHEKPILKITKGKWNDFIVHIKWSAGNRGLVEVWHRLEGDTAFTEIYTLSDIPTLQVRKGYGTPQIKEKHIGLYRGSGSSVIQTIYHDNYRMGTTFESVNS